MKIRILLLLGFTIIGFCTMAQISTDVANVTANPVRIRAINFNNNDSLYKLLKDQQYYLQKSRSQTINGIVLMAGGSVISAVGIGYGAGNYLGTNNDPHNAAAKYEKICGAKLALTGLAMMAGSIPYFIQALKNKDKGLKLTCQKTTFGSCNKDYKKVTSLTFSFPIGK